MLINGVVYREGLKVADIAVSDISDRLGQPETFVWVALRNASDAELTAVQHEFGLHEPAVEDARHGHQRPKMEEYGDRVFAVMHLVEFGPTDALNMGEVAIFVGPRYVVSVRNRSTQGFLGVRERCEREPHLLRRGSGFLFYALMDAASKLTGGRVPAVCAASGGLGLPAGAGRHRRRVRADVLALQEERLALSLCRSCSTLPSGSQPSRWRRPRQFQAASSGLQPPPALVLGIDHEALLHRDAPDAGAGTITPDIPPTQFSVCPAVHGGRSWRGGGGWRFTPPGGSSKVSTTVMAVAIASSKISSLRRPEIGRYSELNAAPRSP